MTMKEARRLTAGFSRLRRHLLAGMAAAMTIAAIALAGASVAQAQPQGQQAPPPPNQIPLTAKQVESFIAAVKQISGIIEKIEAGGSGNPSKAQMASLDAAAKKHGFRDFGEYEDVADSISVVMSGIDPQTKQFTQPPDFIKQQIAQVQADKQIDPKERKEILQELNEQLKHAQTVQHPGNIKLVLKYYDKLEAVLQ